MVGGLQPSEPITGSAHEMPFELPRSLDEALTRLRDCEPLVHLLGDPFVAAYTIVKQAEHEVFLGAKDAQTALNDAAATVKAILGN